MRNTVHSVLLLLAMGAWTAALGWIVAGTWGAVAGLAGAVVAIAMAGRVSPWMVLRLYGARPLAQSQAPGLYRVVAELARRAGMKKAPELYYISSPIPNAISVGSRARPGVAVTDGLVRRLGVRELVAVLAHEISHIHNGDLLVMAIADSFARFTGLLGQIGMLMLVLGLCFLQPSLVAAAVVLALGPSLSTLLMLGLSRQREYGADLGAVRLTGDPEGLARALRRIEQPTSLLEQLLGLPGRDLNPSLLRSHPATDDRIERLKALGADDRDLNPQAPFLYLPPVERQPTRTWWGAWF